MDRIKLILNTKNLYIALVAYFFAGYIYPTFIREIGAYSYLIEYLGIYEKVLWVFLLGYAFTLLMRNPVKKTVLKVRLYFFLIISIALGYLYLLQELAIYDGGDVKNLTSVVMHIGILNINLGYLEVYTFLKLYLLMKKEVFIGVLLFVIFVSTIIICGKFIKWCILSVFGVCKKRVDKIKEEKLLQEELKVEEERVRVEKEIQIEIENIQREYGEPVGEEENDISIKIPQKERDPSADGF